MQKIIRKKILPQYFDCIITGEKKFEIRKDEDDIQTGDVLVLEEWNNQFYTGRKISKDVKYVLRSASNYGLQEGYCIIGF